MSERKKVVKNPVGENWDIKVIYGYSRGGSSNKFIIEFTDKVIYKDSFILEWKDFKFNKKVMVEKSGEVGISIASNTHTSILDYVDYLKLNRKITRLELKETIEDYILKSNRAAVDNAIAIHADLLDCIEDYEGKFTTLENDDFDEEVHWGCILNDVESIKKYGDITVAITNDSLHKMTGIVSRTELLHLKDTWSNIGLLKGTGERRKDGGFRNEQKVSNIGEITRTCIIKIDIKAQKDVAKYD